MVRSLPNCTANVAERGKDSDPEQATNEVGPAQLTTLWQMYPHSAFPREHPRAANRTNQPHRGIWPHSFEALLRPHRSADTEGELGRCAARSPRSDRATRVSRGAQRRWRPSSSSPESSVVRAAGDVPTDQATDRLPRQAPPRGVQVDQEGRPVRGVPWLHSTVCDKQCSRNGCHRTARERYPATAPGYQMFLTPSACIPVHAASATHG